MLDSLTLHSLQRYVQECRRLLAKERRSRVPDLKAVHFFQREISHCLEVLAEAADHSGEAS